MSANSYFIAMCRAGEGNHYISYKSLIMKRNSQEPTDQFPGEATKSRMTKYFDYNTCRESVMYRLNGKLEFVLSEAENRKGIIGIRCFGSVHSYVGQYLFEKKGRIDTLEKFLFNMFQYKFRVRVGKYSGSPYDYTFPITTSVNFVSRENKRETFDKSYYTTLYMRSWDTKWNKEEPQITRSDVSLILEILRERQIVEKICEHKINNAYELALEYFRLGILRERHEDFSFPMLEVADIRGTLTETLRTMGQWLSSEFNGEGADHLSMVMAGFYAMYINLFTKRFDKGTGPVGSASYMPKEAGEKVAQSLVDYFRNDEENFKIVLEAMRIVLAAGSREAYHTGMAGICTILRKVRQEMAEAETGKA